MVEILHAGRTARCLPGCSCSWDISFRLPDRKISARILPTSGPVTLTLFERHLVLVTFLQSNAGVGPGGIFPAESSLYWPPQYGFLAAALILRPGSGDPPDIISSVAEAPTSATLPLSYDSDDVHHSFFLPVVDSTVTPASQLCPSGAVTDIVIPFDFLSRSDPPPLPQSFSASASTRYSISLSASSPFTISPTTDFSISIPPPNFQYLMQVYRNYEIATSTVTVRATNATLLFRDLPIGKIKASRPTPFRRINFISDSKRNCKHARWTVTGLDDTSARISIFSNYRFTNPVSPSDRDRIFRLMAVPYRAANFQALAIRGHDASLPSPSPPTLHSSSGPPHFPVGHRPVRAPSLCAPPPPSYGPNSCFPPRPESQEPRLEPRSAPDLSLPGHPLFGQDYFFDYFFRPGEVTSF